MTSREASSGQTEALIGQLIELAKHLEVVNGKDLRRALQPLTADTRVKRFEIAMRILGNFIGQLFGAALVSGFLWLAYQMILRGESGFAVLLTGLPASSMAAIFVVRKMPDVKALGTLARQVQVMSSSAPQVPPQAGAPAPDPAQPSGGGAGV